MPDKPLLPLFLDVADRRAVVTGSGPAAVEAARRLLAHGARVVVVAPRRGDVGHALGDGERLRFVEATPAAEHLDGCALLVAASEDEALDAPIAAAARAAGVVVVGRGADAFLGTARGGPELAVAVTTRGACPELEARLAEQAAAALTPEHAALARVLGGVREKLAERFPDEERRARIWASLLDEGSPVLALLRAGDEDDAIELAERMAWGTG